MYWCNYIETLDVPTSWQQGGGSGRAMITGGITLSAGLFYLVSLILLYILFHTRRTPEKMEDNFTVESSCDLGGVRHDIVLVETSSLEQPIYIYPLDWYNSKYYERIGTNFSFTKSRS